MEIDAAGPETGATIFILLSNAFVRRPACRSWLDRLPKLDQPHHLILAEQIDEASVPAFAADLGAAYRLYHEDGRPASPVNWRVSEYRRLAQAMRGPEEDFIPPSEEDEDDLPEYDEINPHAAPGAARRGELGHEEAPPRRRGQVIVVERKRRWELVKKPPA